ncbi:MAG: hypothetical protein OES79_11055 [Planctomycetota bacterium]|nr:hypothetical protein [Planctomycetota bacterium]
MKHAMLAIAAALLVATSAGCTCLQYGRSGCSLGCAGGCNQCGLAAAHTSGIDHHGDCHCANCTGGGPFQGGNGQLGNEYRATRRIQGPAGPPSAQITYPYYTTRGPRDFLNPAPPSIGP